MFFLAATLVGWIAGDFVYRNCGDIAIFVIFQYSDRRHLGFSKIRNFNGTSAVRVQCASLYQISSQSVIRLQRYGDFTVFLMVVVRHLGFFECLLGPPTTTTLRCDLRKMISFVFFLIYCHLVVYFPLFDMFILWGNSRVARHPVFYGSHHISAPVSRLPARSRSGDEFSCNLGTRETGI